MIVLDSDYLSILRYQTSERALKFNVRLNKNHPESRRKTREPGGCEPIREETREIAPTQPIGT